MNELEYEPAATPPDHDPAPWRLWVMLCFAALAPVAGIATYVGFLALAGQWAGSDLPMVVFAGLMCYGTTAGPIWMGVLALARVQLARHCLPDPWRWAVHLALPPLVTIVPIIGMHLVGGTVLGELSFERLAFLTLVVVAGAVFGAGWHLTYGARRWTRNG